MIKFSNKTYQSNIKGRAMKDYEKREIVERLYRVWVENPHLRFGQLVKNVIRENLYNVEDSDLIDKIESFYDRTSL